MKSKSERENYRLAELYSFEILDTERDSRFDQTLFMASVICQASMGYISFIDRERLWFKSTQGLENACMPRDSSLAEKLISLKKTTTVSDLEAYDRKGSYLRNLNTDKINFYRELPLTTVSGEVIGSLCLLDQKSIELSRDQMISLETVAKHIVYLLELGKLDKKARSVGELTNEIAHELNNPLSVILGSAEHLINNITKDQLEKDVLLKVTERITASAARIERIIKSMRQFSRTNDNENDEETSVGQLLRETIDLFEEKFIATGIEVQLENPVDVSWYGNSIRLSQVIFNLINNAGQALEELQEKWIKVQVSVSAQSYLFITVTDSGAGIPKEIAEKIMKPFFTTKANAKGTGLGLSICKDIVESYRGELSIDHSSPHTKFIIKLPLGG